MHYDDRISLEPGSPSKGQTVKLEYRGLLAQSGADSVWLHCGFDGWSQLQDIPMSRTYGGSFSCTAEVRGNKEMNFCFKDSANHWDNNNGHNWTVPIK
ncbi:MAG: carbohydrate-binding protein [Bacillota bacterium]